MIKSMTGFGRCEIQKESRKFTVELKSVNHRYLDVNIRMPKKLNFFETAIRTLLKQYANRGKVDIFISCEDLHTYHRETFSSISHVLETYYATKNQITRIRQKSADLRHIVQTALERARKKYALQMRQLSDTEDRDKYKVYGELIHTYGYNLEPGAKVLEALNYYNNEMVKIPLDATKTPLENAQRYFEKYNKQKRTFEALSKLTEETKEDITYLESVTGKIVQWFVFDLSLFLGKFAAAISISFLRNKNILFLLCI